MQTRRLEIGAAVTLLIAIISGAAFIGSLNGSVSELRTRVESLSSGNKIESMKEDAIRELQETADGLKTKLADVSTISMPIGSIIDYVGPIESDGVQADADLGDLLARGHKVWAKGHPNWVVCNGATLSDDEYDSQLRQFDKNDVLGFQVPDLRGRFTRGTTFDNVAETGGKKTENLILAHTHGLAPCGGANGRNALQAQAWVNYGSNCNERTSSTTGESSIESLTIDLEPPYFGVLKIMRIW